MINGLEGIPGSGKSYEATVFHVLDSLKKGRKVITNLPLDLESFAAIDPAYADLIERRTRPMPILGTWDADRVDENGIGNAYVLASEDISHQEFDQAQAAKKSSTIFAGVWDYYSTWKHPVSGLGPLFVIDECHVAMPSDETDPQVVEWFKLHRHFNADVLLMTQSFRDINQPIARLMAMLVKVRKADILGKKDHYIRKVHGGYRGACIATDERKYRPEMFRLYKSHTQGNAVAESAASDVSPFIVKFNRFKWAFIVLTACCVVWAFWPAKPKPKLQRMPGLASNYGAPAWINAEDPNGQAKGMRRALPASAPRGPASAPNAPAIVKPLAEGDTDPYPEPYGPKGLHITGHITAKGRSVYSLAVSQGMAVIGMVTDADLVKVGYSFQGLSDCTAVITFGTKKRTLVCDSPAPSLLPGMQATGKVI